MNDVLDALHWIAGLVVLAEALNKLERTDILSPEMSPHHRLVDGLKALAWALLALGGGGAVFAPVLLSIVGPAGSASVLSNMAAPSFAETCVLVGFAVLIVRTRVKEG